jgi:hypothetical protein
VVRDRPASGDEQASCSAEIREGEEVKLFGRRKQMRARLEKAVAQGLKEGEVMAQRILLRRERKPARMAA